MEEHQLIPHLFRTEFRKIVAVLIRSFGVDNIDAAEDIASDTFVQALETWPYKGLPANPQAWLYTVAKRKAINGIQRQRIFDEKISTEIAASDQTSETDIDLSDKNIEDSQLRMIFAVCHPAVPAEAQIALALRLLCGFGIEEIADAFLTNKETINKRLLRAKDKMRREGVQIEFPQNKEIVFRLEAVLRTLYLVFSEGYYSESNDALLREDLCFEAMRLTHMLTQSDVTNAPGVNALLALMCFHASRFRARKAQGSDIVLYDDQDDSLWDQELIARGAYYLHEASRGERISKYHLEAAIAWWHTSKTDSNDKWKNILRLYDELLKIEFSPVAALNRIYALSKVMGKREAIHEAERLNIVNNHYYYVLLGELYRDIDKDQSRKSFEKALSIVRTKPDREIIQKKLLTVL